MAPTDLSLCCQADTKKAEDAKVYLGLPATWLEVQQEEMQTGRSFHHSGAIAVTKDSFHIASLTCSTKLTQNGEDHQTQTANHVSVSVVVCRRCSVENVP